jgi:FkbM family methyltransferase
MPVLLKALLIWIRAYIKRKFIWEFRENKMKKNVVAKDRTKFDLFAPLKIFINSYNHYLARQHLKIYPQLAVFAFDHIGLCINHYGRYESRTLCLAGNYLESVISSLSQTTALDIGANIGNHSLYFSDLFEEVFAFEPSPRTFALLKFNTEHACLKRNIKCFNFGLSDQNSELLFETSNLNVGGSRIVEAPRKIQASDTLLIEVKRADDLPELYDKKISLIKIDVEGHELAALKGAKNLIERNNPIILFEQHASDFSAGKSDVVEYLRGLNYRFLTIERRFYFGEKFIFRLFGLILRYIFGSQLTLVEKDYFQQRYYDMVIAVPK